MDPLIVKLLTILIVALVIGVCIYFIEKVNAPAPFSAWKWLAQAVIAIIGVIVLLGMII